MKPKHLRCAVLALAAAAPLNAEELRFDNAAQWRQWTLPLGIVELTPQGVVRPLPIRRNINAALNALDHGGGIRGVGSNRATAALVFDGDPATGWQPASGDLEETGWIEVDLGRGVPASRVSLVFDGAAPPFEIFNLLLSTGEQFIDHARVPVPGTLTYRIAERFGANSAHRIDFAIPAIPPTPIQFVRFEALKAAPDARLVEIEVEALGDNLVSGLYERGGNVEIIIGTSGGTDFEAATLTNALRLIDGRINTYWRSGRVPRASNDVWAWITLDLGAVYWVDLVHHIGHIDRGRHFNMNFHEMMTSDGSLAADGSLRWTKHFSGVLPWTIRGQGMVAHRFDPLPTRFVRIFFKTWDAQCTTASGTGAPVAPPMATLRRSWCSARVFRARCASIPPSSISRAGRMSMPCAGPPMCPPAPGSNCAAARATNWSRISPSTTRISKKSPKGNGTSSFPLSAAPSILPLRPAATGVPGAISTRPPARPSSRPRSGALSNSTRVW